MSTYRLDKLMWPQSVAVIGASPRATSPGHAVLRNLKAAGFPGPIGLVNPHYDAIAGIAAVRSFHELAQLPELVVIAAPPTAVPSLVATAGEAGSSAAVIITAGLGHGGDSLAEAAAQAARSTGLRLVGHNCLGVLAPVARLNASFAASMLRRGDLALISHVPAARFHDRTGRRESGNLPGDADSVKDGKMRTPLQCGAKKSTPPLQERKTCEKR